MLGQQKRQDIEELMARMDKARQNLVNLFMEEQAKPSSQGNAAETGAPHEAPEWSGAGKTVASHSPQLAMIDQDAPGREEYGLPAGSSTQAHFNDDNGRPSLKAPEMPGSAPLREESPARGRITEPAPGKTLKKGWGQKIFNFSVLVLLLVALGGLSFLIVRTHWGGGKLETEMLAIRGKDGVARGWLGEHDGLVSLCLLDKMGKSRIIVSLDETEGPSLTMFDKLQQKRAEIKLGPGGEPVLNLIKDPTLPESPPSKAPIPEMGGNPGAVGQTAPSATALPEPVAPKTVADRPVNPEKQAPVTGPAVPAVPEVEGPAPVVAPAEAKAPAPALAITFVGSSTSNKYHYPNCKWVKAINPQRLVTFTSVQEAQGKDYAPCPICKPPLK